MTKHPDERHLWKGRVYFGSQFKAAVHHDEKVKWQGLEGVAAPAKRQRAVTICSCSAHSPHVIQPRIPAQVKMKMKVNI